MTTATLRRLGLAFRIGWFLRGIPVLVLMAGCASAPAWCEFPLWVTVTSEADAECRALAPRAWRRDDGSFVQDTDTINGCAPKDRIITNGTESNMGHELAHQVERNCK